MPSRPRRGRVSSQTMGRTARRRCTFGGFWVRLSVEFNPLFDAIWPEFASLLPHCHTLRLVTARRSRCMLGGVSRPESEDRTPTFGLLLGLIVTLSAVVAYSAYITFQISGLRRVQTELVDRNRKDSLQLLRIQNDLNLLAVAMRDMIDNDEHYPLTAWSAQFQRIRTDLDDAMRREEGLAATGPTPDQRAYLGREMTQFWDAV